VVIMAVILIIYFGMEIVEEKYPNAIKNIANNFNRNNQNIFF
jgi:hypothetical protein